MTTDFKDINIISMDDTASTKSHPNLPFFKIVLNLSASPPDDWAAYFNERWEAQFLHDEEGGSYFRDTAGNLLRS